MPRGASRSNDPEPMFDRASNGTRGAFDAGNTAVTAAGNARPAQGWFHTMINVGRASR